MGTDFANRWYHKNLAIRKEKQKQGGVQGVLPLFPGDLMIMRGTFQENMVQKTLPLSAITSSTIVDYPAVNPRVKKSLEDLVDAKPNLGKSRRVEITLKRNVIEAGTFKRNVRAKRERARWF